MAARIEIHFIIYLIFVLLILECTYYIYVNIFSYILQLEFLW